MPNEGGLFGAVEMVGSRKPIIRGSASRAHGVGFRDWGLMMRVIAPLSQNGLQRWDNTSSPRCLH